MNLGGGIPSIVQDVIVVVVVVAEEGRETVQYESSQICFAALRF